MGLTECAGAQVNAPGTNVAPGAARTRRRLLVAGILLVTTLNMRAGILCVPPVLGQIRDDLHLSASAEGLLVSLPVVCFGVCAFAAPRIARRLGLERTLVVSMLILAVGILLRLDPSAVVLFAGTAVIGAAIGISNVVVPALIKRDFHDRIGLITGLYVTTMLGMGAVASGGTVPLMNATGIGWRWAVAVWAAPALVAALAWTLLLRRSPQPAGSGVVVQAIGGLWRDRLAWRVTLWMGLQSLSFYAVAAWLPTLLSDNGLKRTSAGVLLALTSAMGIPSSLGASMLAGRQHSQTAGVYLAVGISAIGLLGFVVAPASGAVAWSLIFGIGEGASLGLALTFIGLRSPDSRHATQLAGMAQSFGYLLAAIGPLCLGDIHAAFGNWTVPMALVTALMIPQLVFGLGAARPGYVGG